MKKTLLVLVAMVIFLCACWHYAANISEIESKWGPPAKVVRNDQTIKYFWHFNEAGYGRSEYWMTYEFTCDSEGKIISKRSYPKQPFTLSP